MAPVCCREIIEGKEYFLVLNQALHCVWILVFIGVYKVIIDPQRILFGLCRIHLFAVSPEK